MLMQDEVVETENQNFEVSETSIKDLSMLGTHGKNLCYNLDVHWMTQTCGDAKNATRTYTVHLTIFFEGKYPRKLKNMLKIRLNVTNSVLYCSEKKKQRGNFRGEGHVAFCYTAGAVHCYEQLFLIRVIIKMYSNGAFTLFIILVFY